MGGALILLRLLWRLALLVLLALPLPLLLAAMTPILMLVWIVGLIGMLFFRQLQDQLHVTWLGWLLVGLWWPLLLITATIPALVLVIAGALHFDGYGMATLSELLVRLHRELPGELRQLLPQSALSLSDWGWICVAIGTLGFSSNCVYALIDIPWRLKQIGQVRALPRAKARSAAVGLAEMEGIARATSADGVISKTGAAAEAAQPFYLEDETGRILVDPRNTPVRPGSVSATSMRLNEVEEGIRDGDRVYVLGNVQMRAAPAAGALDAERLVIRPLAQTLVSSPIGSLLFASRHQPADRDAPNVFIVDKGRERDVVRRLRVALADACFFNGVYLAGSLWLVHTGWQWLG